MSSENSAAFRFSRQMCPKRSEVPCAYGFHKNDANILILLRHQMAMIDGRMAYVGAQ